MAEEFPYNPIFGKLTDSDAEHGYVVGLIAYGLYKKAKREWVKDFQERENRAPDSEELQGYHHTVTDEIRHALINQAISIMAESNQTAIEEERINIIDEAIEENRPIIEKEVLCREKPEIIKVAAQGSFWKSVRASMLATLLWTGIIVFVAGAYAASQYELGDFFTRIGQALSSEAIQDPDPDGNTPVERSPSVGQPPASPVNPNADEAAPKSAAPEDDAS